MLAAKLEEMKTAEKGKTSTPKVVVVPRDRGTKLAGRPTSDKDPEVREWAEDMRRLTKDMSDEEGAQLVLDHLTAVPEQRFDFAPHQRGALQRGLSNASSRRMSVMRHRLPVGRTSMAVGREGASRFRNSP